MHAETVFQLLRPTLSRFIVSYVMVEQAPAPDVAPSSVEQPQCYLTTSSHDSRRSDALTAMFKRIMENEQEGGLDSSSGSRLAKRLGRVCCAFRLQSRRRRRLRVTNKTRRGGGHGGLAHGGSGGDGHEQHGRRGERDGSGVRV